MTQRIERHHIDVVGSVLSGEMGECSVAAAVEFVQSFQSSGPRRRPAFPVTGHTSHEACGIQMLINSQSVQFSSLQVNFEPLRPSSVPQTRSICGRKTLSSSKLQQLASKFKAKYS